MSDASTAHGAEPAEPIKPEPFFPSEGDFSTVVPLSEVARAPHTAERSANDGRPAEAAWARAERRGTAVARRGARVGEEEETLVPARAGRRREARVGSRPAAGQRPWTVTAAAVLLSVLAGVAAGSYLVWSKRPAGSNAPPAAEAASQEVAADTAPPAPAAPPVAEAAPPVVEVEPVAPEPPARAAEAATEAKPERSVETPSRAEKSAPPTAEPTTRAAAEPATRDAARPRARAERAAPDATPAAPAPRPARNDAPARRAATTTAARRTTRPATAARQLPVSAPPPSSKSKTVIQWP
jgi:hypothetical protein